MAWDDILPCHPRGRAPAHCDNNTNQIDPRGTNFCPSHALSMFTCRLPELLNVDFFCLKTPNNSCRMCMEPMVVERASIFEARVYTGQVRCR